MSNTSENPTLTDEFLTSVGSGFITGAVGGTFHQFLNGSIDAVKGQRIIGGIRGISNNVPQVALLASNVAFWSGFYKASESAMSRLRQKDDIWNKMTAGSVSGLLFHYSFNRRLSPAIQFGLACGTAVCMINAAGTSMAREAPFLIGESNAKPMTESTSPAKV